MNIWEKLLKKVKENSNYEPQGEAEKALIEDARKAVAEENEKANADQVNQLVEKLSEAIQTSVKEAMKETAGTPQRGKATQGQGTDSKAGFTSEEFKTLKGDEQVAKIFELASHEDVSDLVPEMSKESKIVAYFKAIAKNNEAVVKALSEGTNADGGYLVPTEFRAELIRDLNMRATSLRGRANVFPMSREKLELPSVASEVQMSWGTENTEISTTTAHFGDVILTAYRMNAILYTSRELVNDSSIALVNTITTMFADAVAREENKVFTNGSGTGRPKGVNQYSEVRSLNAGGALSYTHINSAYWRVPAAYRDNAVWVMNSRAIENITNMRDDQNRPLIQDPRDGGLPTLKGRPVIEENSLASSTILFGDWRYYYVGDREQMTVETTTEAGDTWKKHQIGIKVIERIDGRLALPNAFYKITTTGIS